MPWAQALGEMLARIHQVPCGPADRKHLLGADTEASWFLRSDAVPAWMKAHPQGASVWSMARELIPCPRKVAPTLVRFGYWPGNILWDDGQIAAVVDWEEASYGDRQSMWPTSGCRRL